MSHKPGRGFTGLKHSSETCLKISMANHGKQRTPEMLKKMSIAHKGKPHTSEWSKKIGEAQKGEKSHCWKGGRSFEPYCPRFNDEFRERVRKFFNHKCLNCGKSQEENGRLLSVHHVLYNKKACCDDSIPLFAPLCVKCHAKNQRPDHPMNKSLVEKIDTVYGGKCYLPKEVELCE